MVGVAPVMVMLFTDQSVSLLPITFCFVVVVVVCGSIGVNSAS